MGTKEEGQGQATSRAKSFNLFMDSGRAGKPLLLGSSVYLFIKVGVIWEGGRGEALLILEINLTLS